MTYTLTQSQVSTIRLDSTDIIEPFLATYEQMALFYDQTEGNYNLTVFKVVQLMQAIHIGRRPRNGDKVGMEVWETRYKQLCERLEHWQKQAGVVNGSPTTRTLDSGIDTYDSTIWGNE